MFVELLGLPASGKSTLIKQLSQHYRSLDVVLKPIGSIADQDASLPGFVRRNAVPRAIYRLEQFRASYPDCLPLIDMIFDTELAQKALLVATAVDFQTFTANPALSDIAVVDEGFLHRGVYGLAKREEPAGLLDAYCRAIPVPDAIIFLDLPAKQAFERAVARLSQRVKTKKTQAQILTRIKRAHGDVATLDHRRSVMQQAAEHMARRGAHVIRLDGLAPVAEVCAQAIAGLDRLHLQPARPRS